MDIDGGERILDVRELAKYELWFISVHEETKFLIPKLEAAGGLAVDCLPEVVYAGGTRAPKPGKSQPNRTAPRDEPD